MTTERDYPIEPLTNDAWQRIERGVFRELVQPAPVHPRRFWQKPFVLSAAACVLLVAAGVVKWVGHDVQPATFETAAAAAVFERPALTVKLEANSLLRRVQTDSDAEWLLVRGAAEFKVAPRPKHTPLAVSCADVRVEVVGTVFRVVRVGQSAEVHTLQGRVRLLHAGQAQLLSAGQHWPPTVAADLRPAAASTVIAVDAGSPLTAASPAPLRRDTVDSLRMRYEQAAALEHDEPLRALAIYRVIAEKSGAWASTALFAKARLELERRMYADAERDLRAYLARFPQGPNASDARALLADMKAAHRVR